MRADALTPVSVLCLAILHRGEATGYEIRKESVEGDYRYFVDASYGSIYPALARLATDGFVTVRDDVEGGRSKKIYAITDSGRRALVNALTEPPGPDVFRSRFLLMAKFAHELPADVVAKAVADRRANLQRESAHMARIIADTPDQKAVQWIASYGAACMNQELAFLDAHGDALVAIAVPLKNAAE